MTGTTKAGGQGLQEDPGLAKIRTTVNWYNKHGGLKKPLHFQDVAEPLLSVGTWQALQILKGLEAKADSIESPTAWVLGYVSKLGGGDILDPMAEEKIGSTVAWMNKHGELGGKLFYREVAGPLARLQQKDAMRILNELEAKKTEVRDPTRWTVGYARFEERCAKVKRTAWWYNQNAKLKQPIQVNEVLQPLGMLETWQAMALMQDLGKKSDEINDPTAWLCAAAMRWKKQDKDKWPAGKDEASENVVAEDPITAVA